MTDPHIANLVAAAKPITMASFRFVNGHMQEREFLDLIAGLSSALAALESAPPVPDAQASDFHVLDPEAVDGSLIAALEQKQKETEELRAQLDQQAARAKSLEKALATIELLGHGAQAIGAIRGLADIAEEALAGEQGGGA